MKRHNYFIKLNSPMKLLLVGFCFLWGAVWSLFAQTTTHNYIITTSPYRTVSDPTQLSDANSNTTIGYFDGLGRLEQTVQKAITPSGADLVSGIVYDPYGREWKKWLPGAVAGNNGAYVSDYTSAVQTTNGGDGNPYATTNYEASPLNRPVEQYGPGADWYTAGKKKAIEYTTNTASTVKLYVVSGTQLTCTGVYNQAALYGQKTTDEDGRTVEEFTDKQGRKVLSRVAGGHDTYYVYDDLDNLRYVLPPLASDALGGGTYDNNTDALVKYAYLYTYDGHKRCITKRLPGCDWIYMVYDKADRLILSQDGNQRAKSPAQWTVNKYDVFGRLLYSGLITDGSSRTTMESNYSGSAVNESYTGSGPMAGYTCGNLTPATLLTVNYYDNYNFLSGLATTLGYQVLSGYDKAYPETATDASALNAKGLLTGIRVYHLDNPALFEVSTLYYDKYDRVVQARATNHLGGYDVTYNALDFLGKPNKTYKTHSINGTTASVTELYAYTYDKAQRLLTTTHSLNGGTTVTLGSNSYDNLGRVQTKTLGGVDATTYGYNVRSWVTGISGSRFTENLFYNNDNNSFVDPDFGMDWFTPCYNGNIGGILWNIPAENRTTKRSYYFQYDNLNRLQYASYNDINSSNQFDYSHLIVHSEEFSYDKMGNIISLGRYGNPGNSNCLSLSYNGNQLTSVKDGCPSIQPYGSEAYQIISNYGIYGNSPVKYKYDANGSIIYDADADISTIQYNVLNLPDIIQFGLGHQNQYTYSADSRKLEVRNYTLQDMVFVPQGEISTLPANSSAYSLITTDYVGNYIYENGTLKEILLPEGYWQNGVYYYYLKDHLGSNRVVINSSGVVMEYNNYYPSGIRYQESITNSSALPYRYNNKELETMNGLNQMDFGARRRGTGLPIWTAVDSHAEKYYPVSPYAYCLNNPIRLVDLHGKDPGDPFETLNEAAKDYGKLYNDNSIVEKREYAATIYQYRNMDGEIRYSYSEPSKGTYDASTPSGSGITRTDVAIIHSHANYDPKYDSDNFSPEDKKLSQKKDMPIFVTTPDGSLKKYDSKSDQTATISTDLPSDSKDPNRKNNIDPQPLPKNEPTKNIWHWLRDNILIPLGEGAQAIKNSN